MSIRESGSRQKHCEYAGKTITYFHFGYFFVHKSKKNSGLWGSGSTTIVDAPNQRRNFQHFFIFLTISHKNLAVNKKLHIFAKKSHAFTKNL